MPSTFSRLRALAARAAIVSTIGLSLIGVAQLAASAAPADAYTVTMSVPAEHPLVNVPFDITGGVTPSAAGSSVHLQRLIDGTFETIDTTQLDANSEYTFTKTLTTVGAYTYRVLKPWGDGQQRGSSPRARIWVTGDELQSGHAMQAQDDLISASGLYRLWMRPNGNLELDEVDTGKAVWTSRTGGHAGAWAILQRDGDLVVHDADGTVLMDSGSGGHADGTYSLTVLGDSNLLIFTPGGSPIWSSHTTNDILLPAESLQPDGDISSPNQRYQVIMEDNGTLVVYDAQSETDIWDSYTDIADSAVEMQSDGNLVLRGPREKPLWSSRTPDNDGAYAIIQDDGNFMVYLGLTPLWGSEGIDGILGDDYPSSLRNVDQDSVIDPWRFYNRECVSFVAWRLNHTNHFDLTNYMDGGHFGNANNWDDNARKLGFVVNNVPAPGAVAQSDKSTFGHVAWVAAVGDGTVTIEDYNYSAPGEYGVRTVPTSSYDYIHFKDLN